jgi:hypothetical protein
MVYLDPVFCDNPVALPGGRTLWHFYPLADDATDEQRTYRRWALARLDLHGHDYIVGDWSAMSLAAAELLDEAL